MADVRSPDAHDLAHQGLDLLTALRRATRPAHDALDRRAEALDLMSDAGLAAFLAMNEAALGTIAAADPGAALGLDRAIGDLRADLDDLGAHRAARRSTGRPDPLASAYVVLGSRLGARMIHRRRVEALGARAARGGRFLGAAAAAPGPGPAFRALCDRLRALSGDGPDAARTIASACDLFALYDAALDEAVGPRLLVPV